MAILGFQLVSTLIGVSLLSKLSCHFSFTNYFVCGGLLRCLLPTDKELMEHAGLTKIKSKGKKRSSQSYLGSVSGPSSDASHLDRFEFPRATPITLRLSSVNLKDIACLPLYSELVWLLDFSVCALAVFVINELVASLCQPFPVDSSNSSTSTLNSFFTPSAINLSLVWCLFLVWFSLSALFSVFNVYFRSSTTPSEQQKKTPNESYSPRAETQQKSSTTTSEWSLLLVTLFSSFVAAMFCLTLDTRFLDLGVFPAYGNLSFSNPLSKFSPRSSSSPISWGLFQASLALIASVIGTLFAFPGLQFGRIYLQAIGSSNSTLTRAFFHLNFIAPLFVVLFWVGPLTEHLPSALNSWTRAQSKTFGVSAAVFLATIFSPANICSLRLLIASLIVVLRIFMFRRHMQAYLQTAQTRLDKLNKEPGRISNLEVQRIVASVFHCFNFAVIQYLAPIILMIGFLCCYKVTTGTPWLPSSAAPSPSYGDAPATIGSTWESVMQVFSGQEWESVFTAPWYAALQETRQVFGELYSSLRVQAGNVSRGVLGFLLWWCLACWQTITITGMTYYRYLD